MLIAEIKEESSFGNPSNDQLAFSKCEQAIRNAGVIGKEVRCYFHEGQLAIHGEVPNYCQKQLAQESVRWIPGVVEISNHLSVIH